MPAIDLRAVLAPVVSIVADTVFPDVIAIERPVRVVDSTGDPHDTYEPIEDGEDIPALIEPLNARTAVYFTGIPIQRTDVTIMLPGDRDVRQEYRIRASYEPPADPDARAGDRWDVVGVARDPARVTTMILGRRTVPGTPADEAGS